MTDDGKHSRSRGVKRVNIPDLNPPGNEESGGFSSGVLDLSLSSGVNFRESDGCFWPDEELRAGH